ncbi:MAG: DUF2235 domain-containing protein [Thermodesulfobacteriota bacterium]
MAKRKNIVLCADGTGNRGGYTPDSNVYRMYHAVDIHDANNPQEIYYDNGVGTEKNKFWRAFTGAMGFGFGANVRDLYKFLARKYEPGDQVFLFGFSRGAATIRALSGFIATCGLVDGSGLSNDALTKRVNEEFANYRKWRGNPDKRIEPLQKDTERCSHGVIDVQFIGVWDTVSALGFPKRTDITSLGMYVLNWLCVLLDHGTDKIPFLAHLFYNYELTDNVKYAYQALAMDDARTAFWPWVWDEHGRTPDNVEQVWFAGMHSNVGGGYNRSGMAKVTLEWMMVRASRHGLKLRQDKMSEVCAEAHVDGRMYDSRDGPAVFYRYHPRQLEKLCRQETFLRRRLCDRDQPFALPEKVVQDAKVKPKPSCNKLLGEIRVHNSLIERMCHRTANYAPSQLPGKFAVAETDMAVQGKVVEPEQDSQWAADKKIVGWWVLLRKWLYGIMLEATLAVIITALCLWKWGTASADGTWLTGHLADILKYFLPVMFDNLINVIVLKQPLIFVAAIVLVVFYIRFRNWARHRTVLVAERLRKIVMKAVKC